MTKAFDVFLSDLGSIKSYSSSILFSDINSFSKNESDETPERTEEELLCKKAEELVNFEQQISEYQSNNTLKNIEKTLNKLQYQINQTLQKYSNLENTKKESYI